MTKKKTVWCVKKVCPSTPIRPIIIPAGGGGGGDQMPWEELSIEQQQAFGDLIDDLDINFDGVELDRLNGHLRTLVELDLLDLGNLVVGTIGETQPDVIDQLDYSPFEERERERDNPLGRHLGAAPLDDVVTRFIDAHPDLDDAAFQERLKLDLQPLIDATVVRALDRRRKLP